MAGARIVGCNMYPANWTAASVSVDIFHQTPPARDADAFVRNLLDVCREEQVNYVLPLTDVEVDVLSPLRDTFSSAGTVVCLSSLDAIHVCRDKLRIHEVFKDDDLITTIPTWDMDNPPSLASVFPMIAKPRSGRSSEGVIRINDRAELSHYTTRLRGAGYILQPMLDGSVHVTDIVRQQASGRHAAMSRKELLRTSNGAGLTVQMLNDDMQNKQAQRIAERLDLNGCVNIEFLVHKGRMHLMDINPRFSAGVAFTRLAGYDMTANHLRCFSGQMIDDCAPPRPSIYTRRYIEVAVAPINQPA